MNKKSRGAAAHTHSAFFTLSSVNAAVINQVGERLLSHVRL